MAAGSSPGEGAIRPSFFMSFSRDTLVAQWVERWTFNPGIAGSNPAKGVFKKNQRQSSVMGNTPCCGLGILGSNPGLVLFLVCLDLFSIVNL